MILVGSRALALRAPGIVNRQPKDFDFICNESECLSFVKMKLGNVAIESSGKKVVAKSGDSICEFEIVRDGTSSELLARLVESDPTTISTPFGLVPNLDLLFTLKTSHRYLKNSPHFWKTLSDYHKMKLAGAKVRSEYREFLKMREKETYTYKHPSLNQNKDTFFADDGIKYAYDHDTIHQAVAYGEKPAYKYYAMDNEEVKSDKNKFFTLPEDVRIHGVIEEAATLAIERSLVPHPGVMNPEQAWKFALSKVLTSITSGWFREWGYENAVKVISKWSEDKTLYWRKFQDGLNSGIVKPYVAAQRMM